MNHMQRFALPLLSALIQVSAALTLMGHISNRVHLTLLGFLRLRLGMAKRCTSSLCTKMLSMASWYALSAVVFRSTRTHAHSISGQQRGMAMRSPIGSCLDNPILQSQSTKHVHNRVHGASCLQSHTCMTLHSVSCVACDLERSF